jgi:hypothetical protein
MEEKAPLVKRGGWQEATPAIEDEVAKTGRTYCCLCVPVNVGLKLIGVAFILQGVRGFLYVYNGVHSATGKQKAEFDRIVAAMGGIEFLWLQGSLITLSRSHLWYGFAMIRTGTDVCFAGRSVSLALLACLD